MGLAGSAVDRRQTAGCGAGDSQCKAEVECRHAATFVFGYIVALPTIVALVANCIDPRHAPGSNDPQLLYVPAEPLSLLPYSYTSPWLVGRLLAPWALGTLLVYGAERIFRPIGPALWHAGRTVLRPLRTAQTSCEE